MVSEARSVSSRLDGIERIAWASATLIALAWSIASLRFPFGWDQGLFALVGESILRGELPYRDAWDIKGPLGYYVYALAQLIFGHNTAGIRVIDLLIQILGCLLFGRLVAGWSSQRVGRWAGLALFFSHATLGWFFLSQPESWVSFLMIAGMAPALSRRSGDSAGPWLWAGIAVGLGATVKPFYLGFALVAAALALARKGCRRQSRSVLASIAVGAMIAPACFVAYFWLAGGLRELIEVHVLYNIESYARTGSVGIRQLAEAILKYFSGGSAARYQPSPRFQILLPATVLGAVVLWRRSRAEAVALVAWGLVATGLVALQSRFFIYHWVIIFPPLLALAAVGLWHLGLYPPSGESGHHRRQGQAKLFVVLIGAIFMGESALDPSREVVRWLRYELNLESEERYLGRFQRFSFNAWDAASAARYIQANSVDDEGVSVIGPATVINYLSRRRNPSRFFYWRPLTTGNLDYRRRYQDEFMASVRKDPPAVIVTETWIELFPALKDLISEQYPEVKDFGKLRVHLRITPRPHPGDAPAPGSSR